MTQEKESELWQQFHTSRDATARQALINHYTRVAQNIAGHYYRHRLDDDVEYSDYLHYAMVGLIESVDRYDPDKAVSFSTFAGYRIKGALLNGLEKSTERREQAAFRRRYQRERQESIVGNSAAEAGKDVFAEMVDIAIELALSYMLEDSGLIAQAEAGADDTPYEGRVADELRQQLERAVGRLPERERFIIQSHYYLGVSFERLAVLLGVSKGRVSQLHKRALQRIQKEYENDNVLDAYY
ncbi:MAG TPA: sigma-70 family RNA polymerase sigma factor [Gammaproteobacteria bacterium]|nr:sigma-70 family RNA polymerase sigma factor [Gammaproteobacteria bacterium]